MSAVDGNIIETKRNEMAQVQKRNRGNYLVRSELEFRPHVYITIIIYLAPIYP